jgi:hypothetical protein
VISYKDGELVKIYVGRDLDFFSLLTRFEEELFNLSDSILQVVEYLYFRSTELDLVHLDLSMFDDIELGGFDPKGLGEKKEFVHETWQKFIEALVRMPDLDPTDMAYLIAELQTCAKFEKVNGLLLAEVGEEILREILWNRKFAELRSVDKYSIN